VTSHTTAQNSAQPCGQPAAPTPIGAAPSLTTWRRRVPEIGPLICNQAIADAQSYIQDKTADLGGNRYEAEFDYWKK
jgi:hypothetical protein